FITYILRAGACRLHRPVGKQRVLLRLQDAVPVGGSMRQGAFLRRPVAYMAPQLGTYDSFSVSSSSETRMRPQYSQTMIFLFCLISNCRCGGMRLKHPPHASRFTVTTASPLRTLERMRE